MLNREVMRVLLAEQSEGDRICSRGFPVRLRRTDRRTAVLLVHLEGGEFVSQLGNLPLAVRGYERAFLLRPLPYLLRNVLGTDIGIFLERM